MSDERPEMTEDTRAPSRRPAHVLHDGTSGTADKVPRRMEAIAQPVTFTPARPRDDASLDDRDRSGRRDREPLRRQAVAVGLILAVVGGLVVFEVGYIVRRSVQRELAPAQAIVVSPRPPDAPQTTVAPPSRPPVGDRTAATPDPRSASVLESEPPRPRPRANSIDRPRERGSTLSDQEPLQRFLRSLSPADLGGTE